MKINQDNSERNNLIQAVKVALNKDRHIVGAYISPNTGEQEMRETLNKVHKDNGEGCSLILGDLNARHTNWEERKNARGRATVRFARETNNHISPPPASSYQAKGRAGSSKPDLLIDQERASAVPRLLN